MALVTDRALAYHSEIAANPSAQVNLTSPWFRLIAGCLAEARSLGLVLFVLDNGALGIMVQGLPVVIPDYSSDRYHSDLYRIDFGSMARACGWTSRKLMPDLSNLAEIMRESYSPGHPSILVEVPVDAEQVVGQNPRANNL